METAKSQDTILVLADPDDAAPVSNGDSVPESHDESHLEQTNTAEETSDVSSDITAMPLPKKLKGTEISIPRKRWLCCTWTLTWYLPVVSRGLNDMGAF